MYRTMQGTLNGNVNSESPSQKNYFPGLYFHHPHHVISFVSAQDFGICSFTEVANGRWHLWPCLSPHKKMSKTVWTHNQQALRSIPTNRPWNRSQLISSGLWLLPLPNCRLGKTQLVYCLVDELWQGSFCPRRRKKNKVYHVTLNWLRVWKAMYALFW